MAKLTYEQAVKLAKKNIEADRFFQEPLRRFLFNAQIIIKSAQTKKGAYIVRKRCIPFVCEYALSVADCTGVVEAIMDKVNEAIKEVPAV